MGKMNTEVENFYISYSDMVTLLLIFFVWLYSISTLDKAKFEETSSAVREELTGEKSPSQKLKEIEKQNEKLKEMNGQIQFFIQKNKLDNAVSVGYQKGQLELNLGESVLFELGKADLKPQADQILGKISELLKQNGSLIQIEGHTDNVPIKTSLFPSNWELSAARAGAVARFLETRSIPPSRISVIGKGDQSPLLPNTTPENRAKNRRVSVMLKVDSEKIMSGKDKKK